MGWVFVMRFNSETRTPSSASRGAPTPRFGRCTRAPGSLSCLADGMSRVRTGQQNLARVLRSASPRASPAAPPALVRPGECRDECWFRRTLGRVAGAAEPTVLATSNGAPPAASGTRDWMTRGWARSDHHSPPKWGQVRVSHSPPAPDTARLHGAAARADVVALDGDVEHEEAAQHERECSRRADPSRAVDVGPVAPGGGRAPGWPIGPCRAHLCRAWRCPPDAVVRPPDAGQAVAPVGSQASRASWTNWRNGIGGRPVIRSTSSVRLPARPNRAAM